MTLQAELHILTGERQGQIILIETAIFRIGRDSDNELVVHGGSVSRHHAVIRYHEGLYYIQDLDSSSGTFLNTEKINATRLYHRDLLRFGDTEMEFVLKYEDQHAGLYERDKDGTEVGLSKPTAHNEPTALIRPNHPNDEE